MSKGKANFTKQRIAVPVSAKNLSVYQASHGLLCDELREWLSSAVEPGGSVQDGSEPTQWRAGAVVYSLLRDHAIDRKGRCRLCRRPSAIFGRRRRRCQVHIAANFYLRQPDQFVRSHLSFELQAPPPHPALFGTESLFRPPARRYSEPNRGRYHQGRRGTWELPSESGRTARTWWSWMPLCSKDRREAAM